MVVFQWITGYIVVYTPDNWLYSSFPSQLLNFFFSPSAHLYRHKYNWNTVACDVKQQIHTYTPITESPLKTGYMVTIPPDNWLHGSTQLKTDYIVVYPPENWLPLYSSLFPIHLLNGSPISENWLYSSISPLNWLYSYLFPRLLVIW